MRVLFRGVVALVILVAAYWGWALAGAGQLASAASRGDAEAVIERVDLQALIRSLSSADGARLSSTRIRTRETEAGKGLLEASSSTPRQPRCYCALFCTPENVAAFLSHGPSAFPGPAVRTRGRSGACRRRRGV